MIRRFINIKNVGFAFTIFLFAAIIFILFSNMIAKFIIDAKFPPESLSEIEEKYLMASAESLSAIKNPTFIATFSKDTLSKSLEQLIQNKIKEIGSTEIDAVGIIKIIDNNLSIDFKLLSYFNLRPVDNWN